MAEPASHGIPAPEDLPTGDFAQASELESLRPTVALGPAALTAKRATPRRALPHVEGYDILEVLGQGAMGVVYKARQHGLKRLVALKMILSGAHAGATERARFNTEAEAVARLRHPHIVQVHEVGEWRPESGAAPLPFLALEYVGGGSLAKHLKGTPQPPRFAAELVRALAEAIQYAHDHQVIHRDLKPGNILLEGSESESLATGTVSQATPFHDTRTPEGGSTVRNQLYLIPKIADFGLAKQLDEQSSQTQSGAIMGTPSYMAPEQASGDASRVGPPADIYALGAVLYEVLTGRPPLKGTTLYETLDLVRHAEPVPPSRLQPKISLDLETICLKCLQKDPRKRYETALALSDDLRRFLAHEPIHARPIGKLERTWRWCLRNPFPAFLIILVGLSLLVGLAVSSSLALWAVRGWGEADEQTKLARERKLESDRRAYINGFLVAHQAWREGRIDEVQQILKGLEPVQIDDVDLRSFEWHWLQRLCQLDLRTLTGHTGTVYRVACSPDGRWLATAGKDETVRIWDRATGIVVHTLAGHAKDVYCIAFSPDSKSLASAGLDQFVRLWDVASGKEQATLAGHTGPIRSLAFSPSGAALASGAGDNTVRLWDLATRQSRPLSDHAGSMCSIAFSADGKRLYSAGKTTDILVRDSATDKIAATLKGHSGRVNHLALSADGTRLGSYGQDQALRLWDTATGKETKRLQIAREMVNCIALSPDGTRLVTGGVDRFVRVWALDTGKELLTLRGHTAIIFSVTCTNDGWQILSTDAHGAVKVWDATASQEKAIVRAHTKTAGGLTFSTDSHRLATCGSDGAIHIWNPELGFKLKSLPGHPGGTHGVCFLPGSGHLVSVGDDGAIRLWDTAAVSQAEVLLETGKNLKCCACSPDANWLAAYTSEGTVLVLNLPGRKVKYEFRTNNTKEAFCFLAFHPTQPYLAIANDEEPFTFRSLETGEVIPLWQTHEPGTCAIGFSPDGRRFVGGDRLSIWDLDTAHRCVHLRKDQDAPLGLAFSPDGRRVAAGGNDSIVRLWDAATGAELLTQLGHTGRVRGVAVSGDGSLLASVGEDGLLQIWNARPLTPERLELREAASLVRFLFGRAFQREEVQKQIREHSGISESVRGLALRLSEAYQKDSK